MQCSQCHAENPEKARFCLECGEKLSTCCRQCQAELPPNAKFCLECGQKVMTAAPAASAAEPRSNLERLIPKEYAERLRRSASGQPANERRLVTILFSDIKGSTALAERMDPEEVLEIINGAFEALIAPIYKHEGTLARLMGDAILAFFGAPVAHEDDPQRAVRAALEIQAGVQAYAAQLAKERGIQGFNVRVGINTGLVIVGEVGSDLRVEYTAIGDAINTAARMEQNAPVGGILISQDTYQHVRGLFEVQSQPPLLVKGKSEPIQTYVVTHLRSRVGLRAPERGLEGVPAPLVGRETELLWLKSIYQDALEESQTRLITVVGEAGVGKSRLLDEFLKQSAADSGLCTLLGRGAPESQAQGFGLWRNLFSNHLEIHESDSAAQVSERFRRGLAPQLLPGQSDVVARLLGFETTAGQSDGGKLETQGPDCIEDYFRSFTSRQPLLVILDDIHWADAASLDLVDRLVNALPERRLLFLCLARPVLYETRPHWGEGRECYERLDLRPLSRRNTRQLLDHLLPGLAPELEDALLKNADGNPYYTEELARMCLDFLARGEQNSADLLAHIPATLTGVLQARLETLSATEKTVLQQASVVGREFWDALLADLTLAQPEQPARAVAQHLESLRSRAMVAQRERSSFPGAHEYTFKHAVLQETVYETVLLKQRKQYHAQVATWLEQHAGDRASEYWPRIAAHYERAGQPEKAADFWQKAAENAADKGIQLEAEQAYRRVLDLLPPDAPDLEPEHCLQRAKIWLELGCLREPRNTFEQLNSCLDESIRLASQCPGLPALAVVAEAYENLAVAHFFERDDFPKGQELMQQAVQFARQGGNLLVLAGILVDQGVLDVCQQKLAEGEKYFLESVETFRRCTFPSEREARSSAYRNALLILLRLEKRRGHEAQAQTYTDEVLEFCRRDAGGLEHPHALHARYQLAILNGLDAEAETLARQRFQLAREAGDRDQFFAGGEDVIMACLFQGRADEAEPIAHQVLEQARAWQSPYREGDWLYFLAQIAQARQDWPSGKNWLEQAFALEERQARNDPLYFDFSLRAYAGHFYAAQGDWVRASDYFYSVLTHPALENYAVELVGLLLNLAGPLAWRGELELLAETVGALESMPMLYTPGRERRFITPLRHLFNLDEPVQAAAHQRGLEQGAMPLLQRLTDLCAPAA
jgi:class 3 adenylate cyclase/ribosomal protein L40E/tetratricopeptide (TPR) repeat protein